jgi:apolipoprotein N-acyltransferase
VQPVAQLASVFGVYGVSGLLAFVSSAIAYALLVNGRPRLKALAVAVVVVFGVGAWGVWRIRDGSLTREGDPIRVGLVQGNIAQEDKWDHAQARRIFTTHIAMTREAARKGAEYVIWPESSTPFMFEEDSGGADPLRQRSARARPNAPALQRGIPGWARRTKSSRVSQDSTGAVRGVHSAQVVALLRLSDRREPCRIRARLIDGDAAGRDTHRQHGDLL